MSGAEIGLDVLINLYRSTPSGGAMDEGEVADYLRPFMTGGQVVMGTASQGGKKQHFGFALWARVSKEAHQALADGDLNPREVGFDGLDSGPAPWIVDMVCPANMADAFLTSTTATVFPGETVMARLLSEDGSAHCIVAQQANP